MLQKFELDKYLPWALSSIWQWWLHCNSKHFGTYRLSAYRLSVAGAIEVITVDLFVPGCKPCRQVDGVHLPLCFN